MADLDKSEYFVDPHSVVRKIWSKSDTVLLIFAGASAEFALNKAVDWLFYTGRLPSDPLGRLFSTVSYAREIIFSKKQDALRAIDTIVSIHTSIEEKRGISIPDWAYRDVLFMLIDYSIRSYELLDTKLTPTEKIEVFDVFKRLGLRMDIKGLPKDYFEWLQMRHDHLEKDLIYSQYTCDLLRQYRKNLGFIRYQILREAQKVIVPEPVSDIMNMKKFSFLKIPVSIYKNIRTMKVAKVINLIIIPTKFKKDLLKLDNLFP